LYLLLKCIYQCTRTYTIQRGLIVVNWLYTFICFSAFVKKKGKKPSHNRLVRLSLRVRILSVFFHFYLFSFIFQHVPLFTCPYATWFDQRSFNLTSVTGWRQLNLVPPPKNHLGSRHTYRRRTRTRRQMGLSLVFSGVSFSHPNQKGSHWTSFSTETEENKICTLKRELAARRRHFLRRLSRKVEDDVGESNHIQAEKPYKSIEMWRQRQRCLAPDLLLYRQTSVGGGGGHTVSCQTVIKWGAIFFVLSLILSYFYLPTDFR
jgi:hypothetical protein